MTFAANTEDQVYLRLCEQVPSEKALLGPASLREDQLKAFKHRVLHRLLSVSDPDAPIRIWVPCSADGLAAYALGAIILESAGVLDRTTVRIYGTDADLDSILTARIGAYKFTGPESVPTVLRPHTYVAHEEWWVARHLRRICMFAHHDTLADPPFPNMSAIVCGVPPLVSDNSLARRALPLFHYSLSRSGGFLLSGAALPEWSRELFDTVDEEMFVYRWRPSRTRYAFTFRNGHRSASSDEIRKASGERLGRLLNQNAKLKTEAGDYRRIMEATRLPFIVADTALRLREFHCGPNAPFELGPEHAGLPVNQLPLNLNLAKVQQLLTSVMLTGQPALVELPDRQGRWYSTRVNPYRDAWGGIGGALALFMDITPQREARVRADEARAQAEAASHAKDQFLAVISHELRTPLAPVMNWTRLLRHAALTPEQRERALEVIERNVLVQRRLIEDLLDVSRIVAGKMEINATEIDLAKVVEAAIETVRASADARRITLNSQLVPDCMLKADPDRLQQVFWNLLSNAIKFSRDGLSVEVTMRCENDGVFVTVTDHGDGIDPEALNHIFEKFWQGEGGSTRRFGGLGLGLTIVRTLVELHGGCVTVHSAGKGQGTSFEVWLPLNAPAAKA